MSGFYPYPLFQDHHLQAPIVIHNEDIPNKVHQHDNAFNWKNADNDLLTLADELSPKKPRSKSISLQDFHCASRALLQATSPQSGGLNESTTILEMLQDLDVSPMTPDYEPLIDTPRYPGQDQAFRIQSLD
jgi:hypothetical protein